MYPQEAIPYGDDLATRVSCVVCSPDGRYLAFGGSEKTVEVFDLVDWAVSTTFHGHRAEITGVAWSPDGRYLTSTDASETALIWEARSGRHYRTLSDLPGGGQQSQAHAAVAHSVAWSPDGGSLAFAGGELAVWDRQTGQRLFECVPSSQFFSVAWSPDGGLIAGGGLDACVRVWDNQGILISELSGYGDQVTAVAWSPDGSMLATSSWDHPLRIWSAARLDGPPVLSCVERALQIQALAWSPNGCFIALSALDGDIRVWTPASSAQQTRLVSGDAITGICWAPHGRFVAAGTRDGTVKLWPI